MQILIAGSVYNQRQAHPPRCDSRPHLFFFFNLVVTIFKSLQAHPPQIFNSVPLSTPMSQTKIYLWSSLIIFRQLPL